MERSSAGEDEQWQNMPRVVSPQGGLKARRELATRPHGPRDVSATCLPTSVFTCRLSPPPLCRFNNGRFYLLVDGETGVVRDPPALRCVQGCAACAPAP